MATPSDLPSADPGQDLTEADPAAVTVGYEIIQGQPMVAEDLGHGVVDVVGVGVFAPAGRHIASLPGPPESRVS